MSLGRLPA